MDLDLYKLKGESIIKAGLIAVPKKICDFQCSDYAIRKLIIAINANHRQGPAKTKKRGEVSGGGRKPWRQKGTGNARQGSIRAPQWRGGGNVFGPTGNENYKHKVNQKERQTAIKSAWFKKITANEIIVVDQLKVEKPRVKAALKLLTNIYSADKILIVDQKVDPKLFLAMRNIINISYFSVQNLSVNIILKKHIILISKQAWDFLVNKFN